MVLVNELVYDATTGTSSIVQVEVTPPEPVKTFRALGPDELLYGLLYLNITPDMVDGAIDAMSEPDQFIARWRWTRNVQFRRDDELIIQMGVAFGKTPAEVDAAWEYASV